ncbi:MAG: DUF58 domain-containing protein [Alphaproteobacteria bacterium]|nr:DUF58 domain-containing protein [Alphaproteobacteria bacterium]
MFFKKKSIKTTKADGLSVGLDELIEQKKYLPYIKRRHNNITSDQAGDIRSAFKGRGMELDEVRTYGYGDDVRDIDWRVTARKNETYTRVFSEEKDREVYVILDLSPYMLFGTKKELKSVSAAKLAALLGWQSVVNKDRFGLILYDGQTTRVFKPQSNYKNLMSILSAISETTKNILTPSQQSLPADINIPLQFLRYGIKSRAMVFILTDFKNISNEAQKSIVALTKRCRVYCINIYDYIEEVPPKSGEYKASYSGDNLIFDTSSDSFKSTYYHYFQDKRRTMENFCKRFSCQYVNIRTDKPLYKQLKIL